MRGALLDNIREVLEHMLVASVCAMVCSMLAFHGPAAVPVNAIHWQNYLGGVVQFHCDEALQTINHAVQLVGYDRGAPMPLYIARKSRGPDFGDEGYVCEQ